LRGIIRRRVKGNSSGNIHGNFSANGKLTETVEVNWILILLLLPARNWDRRAKGVDRKWRTDALSSFPQFTITRIRWTTK